MDPTLSLAMELGGQRGGPSVAEKCLFWGPVKKKGLLSPFPIDTSEDPCSLGLRISVRVKTASVGRGWTRC